MRNYFISNPTILNPSVLYLIKTFSKFGTSLPNLSRSVYNRKVFTELIADKRISWLHVRKGTESPSFCFGTESTCDFWLGSDSIIIFQFGSRLEPNFAENSCIISFSIDWIVIENSYPPWREINREIQANTFLFS